MKTTLRYLILFGVFVCYLQAAFEFNGGGVKNTWGDEYDTYIHADNHAHFDKTDHGQDLIAAVPEPFQILVEVLPNASLNSPKLENHSPPPKFFIDHHSLII